MTDRAALGREITDVRAQGWARAVGEREDDLSAIAAPVLGSRGELAAILGVQGPSPRFGPDAMEAALGPLLEHARAISGKLGWKTTSEEAR